MGAFVLEQIVGRGGQADVYRARHLASGLPVAIKVMTGTFDEERRAAFRQELRTVAGLDHPRIVRIVGIGRDADDVPEGLPPGTPWFAMELGTATLRGRIEDWEGLRLVVLDLLDALGHAHARGVLHLDLKARNVLLGCRRGAGLESGVFSGLRLSDFGVARSFFDHGESRVVGTPATMSPEQVRGEGRRFGPWTDLYGLGHLVWELATGQRAFRGSSREILQAHLRGSLPAFEPGFDVPPELVDWIRWSTAMDPAARPQRALDAKLAFEPLELPRRTTARRPPSIPPVVERDASTLDLDGWTDEAPMPSPQVPPDAPPFQRPPLPSDWRRFDTGLFDPVLPDARVGLLPFAVPRLVGRDAEMDALWASLVDADLTGRPQVVWVRGPAGIGKTRLVAAFAERAHEVAGALVLRVRHHPTPDPSDGLAMGIRRSANLVGLSGASLEARLEEALRGMGQLDVWHPHALATWLEGHRTPDVREVARGLGPLSRQRPVVLVVDDARFGPDTLRFVAAHVEDPQPARVCVVLTTRSGDALETPAEAREVLDALRVELVELGPLTEDAVERLLVNWAGCDAVLAGRIAERARGHAGLALGLLRTLLDEGRLIASASGLSFAEGQEPDLPADLTSSVSRRLDALPAAARSALERIAVAGTTEQRPPDVLALTELVTPVRHSGWEVPPLVADVVLAAMRAEGRLAAEHLRVAGAPGLSAERRGYHLLHGKRPDEAVDPLLEGALAAKNRGDLRSAARLVDLAEQALRLLGDADPRWPVLVERRLDVLRGAGAISELERLLPDLVAQASDRGWTSVLASAAECRALVARQKMDRDAACDAASEAVRLWTQLGRTPERLRATANAAGFYLDDHRDDVTVRLVTEVLTDPATTVRERVAVRSHLAMVHTRAERFREAVQELRLAAAEPEADRDAALSAALHRELAYHLLVVGELDEARLHLDRSEESARRSGSSLTLARALQVRSWWSFLRGDVGEALRLGFQAVEGYERTGGYSEVARLSVAVYQARIGEIEAAAVAARRYLRRGAPNPNNQVAARLILLAAERVPDPVATWTSQIAPHLAGLTAVDFLTGSLFELVAARWPELEQAAREAHRSLVIPPGSPG